jgi:hypothetical protein
LRQAQAAVKRISANGRGRTNSTGGKKKAHSNGPKSRAKKTVKAKASAVRSASKRKR